MGVAVMTRTSGCSPFARSAARCITPKRCCSSMTTSPSSRNANVLHERMRADDEVDASRPPAPPAPRGAAAPASTGQRRHPEARRLEQPANRDVVLLRQDLGRRHEGDLESVLHRHDRRHQRDDRLPGSDVSLQQPVHRGHPLQVGHDLGDDLLLQGDVGSGKTIVALMAASVAMENGFQVAFMAPTKIVAEQHYITIRKLLEPLASDDAVTGSTPARQRREAGGELGSLHLVVGTHALVQDRCVPASWGSS